MIGSTDLKMVILHFACFRLANDEKLREWSPRWCCIFGKMNLSLIRLNRSMHMLICSSVRMRLCEKCRFGSCFPWMNTVKSCWRRETVISESSHHLTSTKPIPYRTHRSTVIKFNLQAVWCHWLHDVVKSTTSETYGTQLGRWLLL